MLKVSFLSSRLTRGLLEPKEPLRSFVALEQPSSAVTVEFHNYTDSVMRAAGILWVPTMCSRDIRSSPLRSDSSQDDQVGEAGLVEP
jgi:hypothetical protein